MVVVLSGSSLSYLDHLDLYMVLISTKKENKLKYNMGPVEVFVIIFILSAVKDGLSTLVKNLLLSLLYEPWWCSRRVESSEWGRDSLNKVVENEAMVGGALHSSGKLQDKIEPKEVVKAVERALSAVGMMRSFLFSLTIEFNLEVDNDSWVLKGK